MEGSSEFGFWGVSVAFSLHSFEAVGQKNSKRLCEHDCLRVLCKKS